MQLDEAGTGAPGLDGHQADPVAEDSARLSADLGMPAGVIADLHREQMLGPEGGHDLRPAVEPRHDVRPVSDGYSAVQVLADDDPAPGQGRPPARLVDLQHLVGQQHGVVLVDGPLVLDAEDLLQPPLGRRHKRGAALFGRHRELAG